MQQLKMQFCALGLRALKHYFDPSVGIGGVYTLPYIPHPSLPMLLLPNPFTGALEAGIIVSAVYLRFQRFFLLLRGCLGTIISSVH
jgi:hypothetical protein